MNMSSTGQQGLVVKSEAVQLIEPLVYLPRDKARPNSPGVLLGDGSSVVYCPASTHHGSWSGTDFSAAQQSHGDPSVVPQLHAAMQHNGHRASQTQPGDVQFGDASDHLITSQHHSVAGHPSALSAASTHNAAAASTYNAATPSAAASAASTYDIAAAPAAAAPTSAEASRPFRLPSGRRGPGTGRPTLIGVDELVYSLQTWQNQQASQRAAADGKQPQRPPPVNPAYQDSQQQGALGRQSTQGGSRAASTKAAQPERASRPGSAAGLGQRQSTAGAAGAAYDPVMMPGTSDGGNSQGSPAVGATLQDLMKSVQCLDQMMGSLVQSAVDR